jgi:gluconate 2-dehydrogenase gamma chain
MSDGLHEQGQQPVTRRAALKVLGVLPVAGALGAAEAQQPQQPVRTPHVTPNQPATATPQPPNTRGARKFFSARELRTAGRLADDIIPRDERSGSATEAGVLDYIDFHMSVRETTDEARTQMHGGLRWIDTEARRRFGVGYHQATQAQRYEILDEIAGPPSQVKPGMRHGAVFFANFRNQVGAGFFSSATGWKDLRYMGNVFNPQWDGCPQPALDKLKVSYDVMKSRVPSQVTG